MSNEEDKWAIMSVKLDSLTEMCECVCFSKKGRRFCTFDHFHTLISVNWRLVVMMSRTLSHIHSWCGGRTIRENVSCVNKSNRNAFGHICWHIHRKTDFLFNVWTSIFRYTVYSLSITVNVHTPHTLTHTHIYFRLLDFIAKLLEICFSQKF